MSIFSLYFSIGIALSVLQVTATWPIRTKAPAFFWTLGLACMTILWPLFLISTIEEAAAYRSTRTPEEVELLAELNSVDKS